MIKSNPLDLIQCEICGMKMLRIQNVSNSQIIMCSACLINKVFATLKEANYKVVKKTFDIEFCIDNPQFGDDIIIEKMTMELSQLIDEFLKLAKQYELVTSNIKIEGGCK